MLFRSMAQYQGRMSGPLLDRIDLSIEVPAVTAADLILPPPSEGSASVALRVLRARNIQLKRYEGLGLHKISTNAAAPASVIDEVAKPDAAGMKLIKDAADKMHLTARGYHRVLKVARTLADLEGETNVGRIHLAEALAYRSVPLSLGLLCTVLDRKSVV